MLNPPTPSSMLNSDEEEALSAPKDLSKGYSVELSVYPDDSYTVSEPEPLAEEASEPGEEPDPNAPTADTEPTAEPTGEPEDDGHISDLTSAIKRLLNVIKRNPIGDNSQESFNAGYNQGR